MKGFCPWLTEGLFDTTQDATEFVGLCFLGIIKSLFQILEHDLISSFDLSIGLWVLGRSKMMLYSIAREETSELLIYELGSVIGNRRYSKSGENASPGKLSGLCHGDGGQGFCFHPFSERIDGYDEVLHLP